MLAVSPHLSDPVATGGVNGGVLTIVFSKVIRNMASGRGGILEVTITKKGPSAGGPLTLKFSRVIGRAAQGAGIFAASASPVMLKSR